MSNEIQICDILHNYTRVTGEDLLTALRDQFAGHIKTFFTIPEKIEKTFLEWVEEPPNASDFPIVVIVFSDMSSIFLTRKEKKTVIHKMDARILKDLLNDGK